MTEKENLSSFLQHASHTILPSHLAGKKVPFITLVGGVASMRGMQRVVEDFTGIPTHAVQKPLFVTPIGIAMQEAVL